VVDAGDTTQMSGLVGRRGARRTEILRKNGHFRHTAQNLRHIGFLAFSLSFSLLAYGCIVPVSPDFQDPPPVANQPPYFFSGFPALQSTFSAGQPVRVTVRDPNPGDTIYIRWASDYPLWSPQSRLLQSSTFPPPPKNNKQVEVNDSFTVTPTCDAFAAGMTHTLVVIVSDRPFVQPENAADQLNRYNEPVVSSAVTVPIMAGWNVIQCP